MLWTTRTKYSSFNETVFGSLNKHHATRKMSANNTKQCHIEYTMVKLSLCDSW
jgi:hypothetical protein